VDSAPSAPPAPGSPPSGSARGAGVRTWVSGASGFVGQHLVQILFDDILICPTRAEADLAVPGALAAHLRASGATRAVHLAAAAGERAADPAALERLNVQATRELAEAAAELGLPLVILSTGYVYGETEGPAREDAELRPRGPYATSKARMEAVLPAGADLRVLRAFNHAGPGQPGGYALPAFAAAARVAAAGGAPRVGDLEAIRDFSDVRDLAALIAAAVRAPRWPRVMNACSGAPRRLRDVLADVFWAAGLPPEALPPGGPRGELRACWGDPGLARAWGPAPAHPWSATVAAALAEHGPPAPPVSSGPPG